MQNTTSPDSPLDVISDRAKVGRNRGAWLPVAAAARRHSSRILKTMIGLSIVSIGAWSLLKNFVIYSSSSAVVAATITTIRTPIDGKVRGPRQTPGQVRDENAVLAIIENPWADDSTVRDLEGRIGGLEGEIDALNPLATEFEAVSEKLKLGSTHYQVRRATQLEGLLAQTEARLEAERAQEREAIERFERLNDLASEGLASSEARSVAERDSVVASQRLIATKQGLEGLRQQLAATNQGIIVDQNEMGSDRPYSRQRYDEVALERIRLKEKVEERMKQRAALSAQLERAKEHLRQMSSVTLSVPRRGRLWQVFAAPEEFVTRGSPLVSLVNCDSILVVAAVSERVFGKLKIDAPARFTLHETGRTFEGKVTQLVGSTDRLQDEIVASGPFASKAKADDGLEHHRVLLSFPELVQAADCTLGQSGEVRFR